MANINESQDVETAGGSNFDDRHRPASGGGSKAPVRVPNRLISSIEGNERLSSVFCILSFGKYLCPVFWQLLVILNKNTLVEYFRGFMFSGKGTFVFFLQADPLYFLNSCLKTKA